MSKPYYIVDVPLPRSQDFNALKEDGLDYIQASATSVWTNLNPSDPGITILDQVCYALTELGYCNDFSLKDILTRPDGKLEVEDQFYLPDQVLTSSPVTIEDYRKYLIDGVDGVNNALIKTDQGLYRTWLLIDPAVTDAAIVDGICQAAFYCLNKRRNLGELFLLPQALQPTTHYVYGQIEIQNRSEAGNIINEISNAVAGFLFPKVTQTGYRQLMAAGQDINTIFNGPLLQKGWIDSQSLGNKRDVLRLTELIQLAGAVSGVTAVRALTFDTPAPGIKQIRSTANEILFVDIAGSVANGYLDIVSKGSKVQAGGNSTPVISNNLEQPELNMVFASQPELHSDLPSGKFRDINTYYSIQNTFPEIFGIGRDSRNENAASFKVAQSRQLKGYLLLFDQLLANQFSQLANVHNLFSFKNSMTAAPSDRQEYYAVQNKLQPKRQQYPVPYRVFSPTYFCQSLYDVPHIRPLLKGFETFNFSLASLSPKEQEHKSWKAYKEDPYNPYMHGMMQFMEDDETAAVRRNDILDHLLARHGESPLLIDTIIDGSKYSGDVQKDRVIFKSLYLQNLGLLSYFKQKAYNYLGASKLVDTVDAVPGTFEEDILCGNSADFIVSSGKINEAEKLTEQSFNDHSALELKICLLFGLRMLYFDFIADHYEDGSQEADLAYWLIMQRRGMILVETAVLLQEAGEDGDDFATDLLFDNSVLLLLPAFMPAINNPQFMQRLQFFLSNTLPVNAPAAVMLLDAAQLSEFIPVYVSWYNSLVYQEKDPANEVMTKPNPAPLAKLLIALHNSTNA